MPEKTVNKAPVAFFCFNRPSETRRVLAAIRQWRPETLLLVVDGPRANHPSECDQVKSILAEIDWPCDVRRNYSSVNLGCRRRMISGLEWVFSEVEEAILLEDDCLPSQSFFMFASEMLERYRYNPEVMMIAGSNSVAQKQRYPYSYTFGRTVNIWGWATWSRAWRFYDEHLSLWQQQRESDWLADVLNDPEQERYWYQKFDKVEQGFTTWDYQWLHTVWTRLGISVIPSKNLVRNIGFTGPRYSNPPEWIRYLSSLPADELDLPIRHPPKPIIDRELDKNMFHYAYYPQDAPKTKQTAAFRASTPRAGWLKAAGQRLALLFNG